MGDMLTTFVELEEPVEWVGRGWYIGCVEETYDVYYLHNDGVVYDTCAPRYDFYGDELSSGWHATAEAAYGYSQAYYNKHGLVYPYIIPTIAENKKESQVMEFK